MAPESLKLGRMNLFGWDEGEDERPEREQTYKTNRYGMAAANLVKADLQIRGYDVAEIDGHNIDLVAHILEKFRRFQVKGWIGQQRANGRGRFGDGGWKRANGITPRNLLSYRDKIDALALVFLDARRVFYVPVGLISTPEIHLRVQNQQACDLSFEKLLHSWR